MHELGHVGSWLQLLSGLVIVALGVFVVSIRPRTRPNVAFAVFAVAFGGVFAITNAAYLLFDQPIFDARPLVEVPRILLSWTAAAALAAVALVFPTPLRRDERRLLVIPVAIAAAVELLSVGAAWSVTTTPIGAVYILGFFSILAVLIGAHALFALRFAAARDERSARLLAYLAGALVLYSGFVATAGGGNTRIISVLSPDAVTSAYYGVLSLCLIVGAALWLRAIAKGPLPRVARNVALLTLTMMLLGLVYVALDLDFGALGIVRMLAVAVLAYAILKHQLLGLDVKVRWGISKGTVAAVFIAVFFIVSEAAQEFFGATLGSQYVGILAAAALVFAIAPLSRLADRLAEKAVPLATVPAGGHASIRLDTRSPDVAYRAALRAAMRDGALTRREEVHLAEVAEALGIGPRRALEIQGEVEEERD